MKYSFKIYRPYRLRDMNIGEKGFVNIYDCFFYEDLFAIPLGVRVYDHIEKEEMNYFFSVRRIGKGLEEKDFDIDFSLLKGREFEETPDLYIELVQKNKKLFLILESEYNPIVVDDLDEYPEDEREAISSLMEEDWSEYFLSLEEKMKLAIEEEDYKEAARLKKLIEKKERSGKNSKQGD